jgi:hypothetical protein
VSIKRSATKSTRSRRANEDLPSFLVKPVEKEKSWQEWTESQPDTAFVAYSMKARFARGALILHPKFGKGAVIAVDASRVTVLFADGPRAIAHALES